MNVSLDWDQTFTDGVEFCSSEFLKANTIILVGQANVFLVLGEQQVTDLSLAVFDEIVSQFSENHGDKG
ncbi:hypothetical protein IR117_10305, partial [Streptococcus danieliae]|nr:hypothetical protein [Streptococcus danieliae]